MFGMGFFEIFMILVIAVIFLGPDKLPKAMVDMAKLFRTLKKTMEDAKASIDKEINIEELKSQAMGYKNSIEDGISQIKTTAGLDNLNFDSKNLENELEKESLDSKQKELSYKEESPTLQESKKPKSKKPPKTAQDSKDSQKVKD